MGPGRLGLSGVGEGLGMHWASINYSKGRAEWGWGGVGHVLGFNSITLRRGIGYKDRLSGAAWRRAG